MKRINYLIVILLIMVSGCFNQKNDESNKSTEEIKMEVENTETIIYANDLYYGIEIEIEEDIPEEKIRSTCGNLIIVKHNNGKTIISTVKPGESIRKYEEIFTVEDSEISSVKVLKKVQYQDLSKMVITKKDSNNSSKDFLLGDFNLNNEVDLIDFIRFSKNYATTNSSFDIAPAKKGTGIWEGIYSNVSPDGKVDIQDFIVFANNYKRIDQQKYNIKSIIDIQNNAVNYMNICLKSNNNYDEAFKATAIWLQTISAVSEVLCVSDRTIIIRYKNKLEGAISDITGLKKNGYNIAMNKLNGVKSPKRSTDSLIKVVTNPQNNNFIESNRVLIFEPFFNAKDFDTATETFISNARRKISINYKPENNDAIIGSACTVESLENAFRKKYGIILISSHGLQGYGFLTNETVTANAIKYAGALDTLNVTCITQEDPSGVIYYDKVNTVGVYYGVSYKFINKFYFDKTIIFNDSCGSLQYDYLAKAFGDNNYYIGYNNIVSDELGSAYVHEYFNDFFINLYNAGNAYDNIEKKEYSYYSSLRKKTINGKILFYGNKELHFEIPAPKEISIKNTPQNRDCINIEFKENLGFMRKIDSYSLFASNDIGVLKGIETVSNPEKLKISTTSDLSFKNIENKYTFYRIQSGVKIDETTTKGGSFSDIIYIPPPPKDITITPEDSSLKLSWTKTPVPEELPKSLITYNIYKKNAQGIFEKIGNTGENFFEDSSVEADTENLYKICSLLDSSLEGPYSDEIKGGIELTDSIKLSVQYPYMEYLKGNTYYERGATAIDAVTKVNYSSKIKIDKSGLDMNTPGIYNVKYSVSNRKGEEVATAIRKVVVRDRNLPVILSVQESYNVLEGETCEPFVYVEPDPMAGTYGNGNYRYNNYDYYNYNYLYFGNINYIGEGFEKTVLGNSIQYKVRVWYGDFVEIATKSVPINYVPNQKVYNPVIPPYDINMKSYEELTSISKIYWGNDSEGKFTGSLFGCRGRIIRHEVYFLSARMNYNIEMLYEKYDTGELKGYVIYENGKPAKYIHCSKSGSKIGEGKFMEKVLYDQLTGSVITEGTVWYENGNIKCTFKNNGNNVEWKVYAPTGELYMEGLLPDYWFVSNNIIQDLVIRNYKEIVPLSSGCINTCLKWYYPSQCLMKETIGNNSTITETDYYDKTGIKFRDNVYLQNDGAHNTENYYYSTGGLREHNEIKADGSSIAIAYYRNGAVYSEKIASEEVCSIKYWYENGNLMKYDVRPDNKTSNYGEYSYLGEKILEGKYDEKAIYETRYNEEAPRIDYFIPRNEKTGLFDPNCKGTKKTIYYADGRIVVITN